MCTWIQKFYKVKVHFVEITWLALFSNKIQVVQRANNLIKSFKKKTIFHPPRTNSLLFFIKLNSYKIAPPWMILLLILHISQYQVLYKTETIA